MQLQKRMCKYLHRRRVNVIRALPCHYLDTVSEYDSHNRVFFIFHVGSFHNIPMYCYGETPDIVTTELVLKKTLPFYKPILEIPIGHRVYAKDKFSDLVKEKKIEIPFLDATQWGSFTIDDHNDLHELLEKSRQLFT